jgi:HTH-type transcriptional regulator, competence development regulator
MSPMRFETFGPWLRDKRKEKGLSQRALAGKIGISFSYLSKIESGEMPPPSSETLEALGKELGLDSLTMHLQAGTVTPLVKLIFMYGLSPEAYCKMVSICADDLEERLL